MNIQKNKYRQKLKKNLRTIGEDANKVQSWVNFLNFYADSGDLPSKL